MKTRISAPKQKAAHIPAPAVETGMFQRRAFPNPKDEEDQEEGTPEVQTRLAAPALQLMDIPLYPDLQREEMAEEYEEEDNTLQKPVQAKLTIGQPGDKYEQEADAMAAKVMRMPDPVVQRRSDEEEEEGMMQLRAKPQIQAKGSEAPAVPEGFASRLAQNRSGGKPLSDETRSFMEPRFGSDFSGVRIHETPDLANSIQAQAFTHGQDIYFNSGKYNPGSSSGKELLAHELTHVEQQVQLLPKSSIQRDHSQASSEKDTLTYWEWYRQHKDAYSFVQQELKDENYKFTFIRKVKNRSTGKWQEVDPKNDQLTKNDTLVSEVSWHIISPYDEWFWATPHTFFEKCKELQSEFKEPINSNKQLKKVFVIGSPSSDQNHPYQFIDAARYQGVDKNTIWLVEKTGYELAGVGVKQIEQYILPEQLQWVTKKSDLSSILNRFPDNSIESLQVFSHGSPGQVNLRYKWSKQGYPDYGLSISGIQYINQNIFSKNPKISFDSCNSGTEDEGKSISQQFADHTGQEVKGWSGRTSYVDINDGIKDGSAEILPSEIKRDKRNIDLEELISRLLGRKPEKKTYKPKTKVINLPEIKITGDPKFYTRAERLNKHYSTKPPKPGWPYDENLRSLWSQNKYDDFTDAVRQHQENMGFDEEQSDGILGPKTSSSFNSSTQQVDNLSHKVNPEQNLVVDDQFIPELASTLGQEYGSKFKSNLPPGLPDTARQTSEKEAALPYVEQLARQQGLDETFVQTVKHLAKTESKGQFARPANIFDARPPSERPEDKGLITAWGVFQFNRDAWRSLTGDKEAFPWEATPYEEISKPIQKYAELYSAVLDKGGNMVDAARGIRLWHMRPNQYRQYSKNGGKQGFSEAWKKIDKNRRAKIDNHLNNAGVL